MIRCRHSGSGHVPRLVFDVGCLLTMCLCSGGLFQILCLPCTLHLRVLTLRGCVLCCMWSHPSRSVVDLAGLPWLASFKLLDCHLYQHRIELWPRLPGRYLPAIFSTPYDTHCPTVCPIKAEVHCQARCCQLLRLSQPSEGFSWHLFLFSQFGLEAVCWHFLHYYHVLIVDYWGLYCSQQTIMHGLLHNLPRRASPWGEVTALLCHSLAAVCTGSASLLGVWEQAQRPSLLQGAPCSVSEAEHVW